MATGGARPGAGRPKGSPNKSTAEIRAIAQKHGKKAIDKLVNLLDSKDERTAMAAVRELLDRGYGKVLPPSAGEGGVSGEAVPPVPDAIEPVPLDKRLQIYEAEEEIERLKKDHGRGERRDDDEKVTRLAGHR